jgi:hypothetical protein
MYKAPFGTSSSNPVVKVEPRTPAVLEWLELGRLSCLLRCQGGECDSQRSPPEP